MKKIDKDERHEFESKINNAILEKNKNNENNNPRNLLIGSSFTTEIFFNPKRERYYHKTFDNKNKINDFQMPFQNKDLFNEFDEKLIDNIFDKIKEGKEEIEDCEFEIKKPLVPNHLLKDEKNQELNFVKNLIDKSKFYIYNFFVQMSNSILDFSQISFCLVLDCSLYLGDKNKFINLILVLSIIKVIRMVNIKYSILLTADDNFKIILKKYDEMIDLEDIIE